MSSYERGDLVDVILYRCGPSDPPEGGRIRGRILNGQGSFRSSECDVMIDLETDLDEIRDVLDAEGSGLDLEDLREGPVYVLRNCQPEQLMRVGE